jgi:hypothetical protein
MKNYRFKIKYNFDNKCITSVTELLYVENAHE